MCLRKMEQALQKIRVVMVCDRDFSGLRWRVGQLIMEIMKLPVECFQIHILGPHHGLLDTGLFF